MFKTAFAMVVATALFVSQAQAHTPDLLSDLVGARAAGGETALQDRGFVVARTKGLTAYWWSSDLELCISVVTANGHYRAVDTARISQCGAMVTHATKTGPGAGCPGDVSEANRYLYPDCD